MLAAQLRAISSRSPCGSIVAQKWAFAWRRAAASERRAPKKSSSGPEQLAEAGQAVAEVLEATFDLGRLGLNEMLRGTMGLEVQRSPSSSSSSSSGGTRTPPAKRDSSMQQRQKRKQEEEEEATADMPQYEHSFFWRPNAEGSPFRDKQKYLEHFQRLRAQEDTSNRHRAVEVVSEEDIQAYVQVLAIDGSVKSIKGLSALLVPKALYANVVKVVLHALQVAFGALDGQVVLGRELWLLRRRSIRSQWRVSDKYTVDSRIVEKLVSRILADHPLEPDLMPAEVQREMYANIITLVLRLIFDLTDSCQLRVLGHTVKLSIQADENVAEAPGWDVDLDSGLFGRFDPEERRQFAREFVDDLLDDDSINIRAVPDILERQLYIRVILVLFDLLQTACNHMEFHLAGLSFRPHLGDNKSHNKENNDKDKDKDNSQ